MNTLKYKGYIGSVAYSEPDKVFFGKIEGIDGLVNYEGESVEELTAAFHEAVDDYLIFCEEHNCKPDKSYSGAFNVRVAPNVHRKIANRASEEGISINAFVKKVLTEAVDKPSAIPEHYMDYFDSLSPEPAMLMDSGRPAYGRSKAITLRVPEKDAAFVAELAARMGWEQV
ncbi:MAG: type II toxin-antitoxin system HicB family antitoxin [Bacteroidales bacterium]|nr:type II toxin-antitoxin system HicB family antitoxin [Bacteroidales bacterium]